MKKIKAFSPTLGREVEFETNGIMGPKHSSLEHIFYDELGSGINLEIHWVKAEPEHSVVQATIWSDKRKVVVNGEATKDTLKTEIARENPATIAFNRAFDRAVLKYLGLYKIYAESENVPLEDFFDKLPVVEDNVIPVEAAPDAMDVYADAVGEAIGKTTSEAPEILDEQQEYTKLMHSPFPFKKYPNKNGEYKNPVYGWVFKNHPEDIKTLLKNNAAIDINVIRIKDANKAKALSDLFRVVELYKKFNRTGG